jgi:hypothetical protein
VTAGSEQFPDAGLDGLPVGHALSDLEDDFFRPGEHVSYADVDRAAGRHGLSAADHAELVERANGASSPALEEMVERGLASTRWLVACNIAW